jgi:AraC-like DNA-binding protein
MLMAYLTKKDPLGYIDFSNLLVDFADGDVSTYDKVKDITRLYPLRPMSNLIVLCMRGVLSVRYGGRRFEIKEGDVLICPPNVKFDDTSYNDDFECRVMCLSDHIIQGLLQDKTDVWHHAVYINQVNIIDTSRVCREEYGFYFSLIRSKMVNHNGTMHKEILLALIRAFLLELCFILGSAENRDREQKLSQGKVLFNKFISLISGSEVKRQPIMNYASKLAITPKYLTMLCLKYSNKTASEWVVQYTTEEIRFYLKSSNLSIKEISAKMGFSNMSHFGSYVRKHLGVSPSEFRHGK